MQAKQGLIVQHEILTPSTYRILTCLLPRKRQLKSCLAPSPAAASDRLSPQDVRILNTGCKVTLKRVRASCLVIDGQASGSVFPERLLCSRAVKTMPGPCQNGMGAVVSSACPALVMLFSYIRLVSAKGDVGKSLSLQPELQTASIWHALQVPSRSTCPPSEHNDCTYNANVTCGHMCCETM